jgi:hypothetical protein
MHVVAEIDVGEHALQFASVFHPTGFLSFNAHHQRKVTLRREIIVASASSDVDDP